MSSLSRFDSYLTHTNVLPTAYAREDFLYVKITKDKPVHTGSEDMMNDYAMDILPDLFGFVPAQTQCEHCDKVILLTDAIITTYRVGEEVKGQEHYCSNACANSAWVHRTGVDA